jgi:hypothetical protein
MSIKLVSTGGGSVTIQEPNTASDFTLSVPATTGTLVLANTTPSFNGIAFPATQSASADANTLDDYEEGTWTPVYTANGGGAPTNSAQCFGYYQKVGNRVTIHFRVDGRRGTLSGNLRISNLPFACFNGSADYGQGMGRVGANWSGWTDTPTTLVPTNGQTYLEVWDASTDNIRGTDMSTSEINILYSILTYITAS